MIGHNTHTPFVPIKMPHYVLNLLYNRQDIAKITITL